MDFLDRVATGANMPVLFGGTFEKAAGSDLTYTGSTPQNRAQTQWLASNPEAAYVDPKTGTSTTYGKVLGSTTQQTPPPDNGGGDGGGGGTPTQQTNTNNQNPIDEAKRAQEEAAARQAEANRQAAMGKYKGMVNAANVAKSSAKGQYDWLIDTIGSNKKDLLNQVNMEERQGIENYNLQDKKTREMYDSSRQEILSTYRDLNLQQEKLLRASGQGQSSRAMEANLRLNNLMGKDISSVSRNEADSLALIGNALTSFKEKIGSTKTSIERDASSKLDKAALDYTGLINKIDADLHLSEQEKETAYAQAEADLSKNKAAIETWAAQQKLEAEKTLASMKGNLDDFILQMTDANGLLNSDLDTKKNATNKVLDAAGYTPLNEETDIADSKVGVYTKPAKSKEELDALLESGQISQQQYQQQLASMTQNTDLLSGVALGASPTAAPSANLRTGASTYQPTAASQRIMQDPLMQAMFRTA